jgi:hypothetical protein
MGLYSSHCWLSDKIELLVKKNKKVLFSFSTNQISRMTDFGWLSAFVKRHGKVIFYGSIGVCSIVLGSIYYRKRFAVKMMGVSTHDGSNKFDFQKLRQSVLTESELELSNGGNFGEKLYFVVPSVDDVKLFCDALSESKTLKSLRLSSNF